MFQKYLDYVYEWSTDNFIHFRKYIRESLIAIFFALTLRSLLITFYKIPSGSMIPTFKIGDVILADRYQFGWKIPFTSHIDGYRVGLSKKPKRGDIVIFQSPPEKEFWNVQIQIKNEKAIPLLLEINNASSSIKRPINRLSDGTINYVFIPPPFQENEKILLPTIEDSYGNMYTYMALHPQIYSDHLEKISHKQEYFKITGRKKIHLYTSYKEESWNYLSLLEFPFTGISVILEVCLQTPLFLFPRFFLFSVTQLFGDNLEESNILYERKYQKPWREFLINFFSFSIYPNRWINSRKDFVKRVVGIEGDIIEIKDSRLYINEIPRELVGPIYSDEPQIYIFESPIYDQQGNSKKTYNVRKKLYSTKKKQIIPFDVALWPYDPTLQSPFIKDMHIGPIVVPQGHFFVMGDNMDASLDSRCWGFVPFRALKGYPRTKIWPIIEKIQ